MNIEEAYNNLSQILIYGRIVTPHGALTGQEHAELRQNLQILYAGAKENQESKQAVKDPEPVEKEK